MFFLNSRLKHLYIVLLVLISATSHAQRSKPKEAAKAPVEASESEIMNKVVENILNQIIAAKLDFNIEFSGKTQKVNGEKQSSFDLKYLDVGAYIEFKDIIKLEFLDKNSGNSQVHKIVPYIHFGTNGLKVVAKAQIKKQGFLKVRFCQNYTVGNDYCDTVEDRKLFSIILKSRLNANAHEIQLKDINVNFDQDLANGNLSFKGNCTAFKSGFEFTSVTPKMKPVDCAFSGNYVAKDKEKFEYAFKFKE